jgi:hypothetical protein
MHRSLLLPTAALAAAFAIGCADPQSPPPAGDPSAPSLRAERFPNAAFIYLGGDPSNPLAVQVGWEAGLTAEDICPNPSEGVKEEGQKGQVIFTPPGGFLSQTHARDANIVVYQFGGGIVTDPCQVVGHQL